ncbi:MAG: hydrogenase iron-sulfur subunit [Chloroflexota bacterium]
MSAPGVKVVVFTCNWDGLSCIEGAAQDGLSYPASVRVVKLACLSRLHHGLILKAFEVGADAVMLLGCEADKCQFGMDASLIEQECERARMILRLLGVSEDRLALVRLQRGDGAGFVDRLTRLMDTVKQMESAISGGA